LKALKDRLSKNEQNNSEEADATKWPSLEEDETAPIHHQSPQQANESAIEIEIDHQESDKQPLLKP